MSEAIVKFENVSKSYGNRLIVKNLRFSIKKGEFVTVMGRSGSGKTTVLKMINGLIKADSGGIYVYGQDISKCALVPLRRRIGYAVQETALFPHMDAYRNIAYVPHISGWKERDVKARVEELADLMNLPASVLKRYPDELSGGEKQRVGIARALAARPDMMLMDEPFGALDGETRNAVQDELLKIWRRYGTTIFFITHDENEALKLGSRIMEMDKGALKERTERHDG